MKTLNTGGNTTGIATGDAGFNNATIKDAIPPASVQSFGSPAQPQRATGTGVQTIAQNSLGSNLTQDAGFLAWLQNNGIGTKR